MNRRFLNSLSLALDHFNAEVNNDFRFQPFAVERKLKMTALVQKSGERGPFHTFPV